MEAYTFTSHRWLSNSKTFYPPENLDGLLALLGDDLASSLVKVSSSSRDKSSITFLPATSSAATSQMVLLRVINHRASSHHHDFWEEDRQKACPRRSSGVSNDKPSNDNAWQSGVSTSALR